MIFESASIQTMVMLFSKNSITDNYVFDYRKLTGNTILADALDLLSKKPNDKATYLFPTIIRENYRKKFLTFNSNAYDIILNKISEKGICLMKSEAANGIHPHYDFVNGQGIFGLSNEELQLLHLSKNELNLIKPYYTTEQIHRYYSDSHNTLWIIYTDSSFKSPSSMNTFPNLKSHLDRFQDIITSDNKPYGLHRAREERFFKGEKVIVQRKCVGKPSFSYSDFDCYVSATFYVIKTNRFNHKYLVGLLNSKLIAFWLKNRGKMQGDNYQLDKEPLLQIPIYQPTESLQQPIITLVDYILFLKQAQNDSIIPIYYENIIDACVYELYFPEEVHAVEKGVIKHLQDIKPLDDTMSDNQKLALINSEFVRLYDNPYHPVRNNVETIENIETIRIIKASV
jgi:adenine-specific DNA-methyltransferase